MIGPVYDHTVFFGDEHFTITEPNDMRFPRLFPSALHRRGGCCLGRSGAFFALWRDRFEMRRMVRSKLLCPLPCHRRQGTAFAVARNLEVDPVERIDMVERNAVSRPQHADQDAPGIDLRSVAGRVTPGWLPAISTPLVPDLLW
jgi:hypothetical protein